MLYTSYSAYTCSLSDFLERISKFSALTDETLIAALIYVDRILGTGKFFITRTELHKLMLTSCVISLKYNMDDYYDNNYYAKIGNTTLTELNKMEKDFLERIEYKLFIDENEFKRYKNSVGKYLKSPKTHMK